tara:strand:+ start:512 stop:916 length:405 start_codon:yes stop_codon:yes gene_type:complete
MTNVMLAKHILSTILGIFFVNVGIAHFTDTAWFEPIVPAALGDPTFWVLLTGIMEIALGLGLAIPHTRRYAGLLMALFLVGIYWANFNMWINDIPLEGKTFATIWHVLRLVGQIIMIIIALFVGDWLSRKPSGV